MGQGTDPEVNPCPIQVISQKLSRVSNSFNSFNSPLYQFSRSA